LSQEEEGEGGEEREVALALFPCPAAASASPGDQPPPAGPLPELARPYVVVPARARLGDVAEHVRQALLLPPGPPGGGGGGGGEASGGGGGGGRRLALRGAETGGRPLDAERTVGEAAEVDELASPREEGEPPAPLVLYYYFDRADD
jgi:hypothetical protein